MGLQQIEQLDVKVRVDGQPRRIPVVVGRGAYRVVRDAVAGADDATVAIEYMPGAVAVQVEREDAADVSEAAALAAALGGGLTAAPARGGFRVRAWLPTEGQPPYPAEPLAAR